LGLLSIDPRIPLYTIEVTILISGAAGFIGSALASRLQNMGHKLLLIDRYSDFYSIDMKRSRVSSQLPHQKIEELDLADKSSIEKMDLSKVETIVHLAAQPGVRVGLVQSNNYLTDNIAAFSNLLFVARKYNIKKFVYASSSSVYGASSMLPFSEDEELQLPTVSYPRTKYINEKLAELYSNSDTTQILGLRFFSVYGPWGRPDMAPLRLLSSALNGHKFKLLGGTANQRDFTYIDDVVDSIIKLLNLETVTPPIINVGGGNYRSIAELINIIEKLTGQEIDIRDTSADLRDVPTTWASFELLEKSINSHPSIDLENGIAKTLDWILKNKLQKKLEFWCNTSI